jgi:hypothetical protein
MGSGPNITALFLSIAGALLFGLIMFELLGVETRLLFPDQEYKRSPIGAFRRAMLWRGHGHWRVVVRKVTLVLIVAALVGAGISAIV